VSLEAIKRDIDRVRQQVGPAIPLDIPKDPVKFVRLLKDPDTGDPLEPYTWQREFLTTTKDRVIMACGRQVGKSTIVASAALHLVLRKPNQLVLVVARTLMQAAELTRKLYTFYRQLGSPIPTRVDRQLSLELVTGSRVVTLPGTPENVRGYSSPALIIVDEAAFIKPEMYFALEPMLAVGGGALYLLSSPNGRVGSFFEIWENGDPEVWHKIHAPANECPRITQKFLDERRDELPWWVYESEYLAEFTETDAAVFRWEDLQRSIDPAVKALYPQGWQHG
jgi:hypothetical protein